jgi:phage gpG-like protein
MIDVSVSRTSKTDRYQKQLTEKTQRNLGVAGVFLESKMVEKIQSGLSPALAPETIARKGSGVPLFDTGELLSQISHHVSGNSVSVGVFGSRAPVAKHHEFGAPAAGIPERSFMRSAFRENREKIKKIMKG